MSNHAAVASTMEAVVRLMRVLEKLTEEHVVEQLTDGNRVWYRLRDPGPPDGD